MLAAFPATSILDSTAAGRSLLTAADNSAQRSLLGLGASDSPTFLAQTLSGQNLTGSSATSLLDLATTWNTTGTPTAINLNVTDTASNGGNLISLRVGGVNRFSVDKTGIVLASSTIVAAGNLQSTAGNVYTQAASGAIGWQPGGSWDLTLFRDAANTLAQRNGVNAQALRVYNTFTDASNYERAKIAWESNVLRIGTENLGTGTTRNLELQASGTTYLTVRTDGHVELPLASRLTWGAGTGTDGVRLRRNGFGLLECVNLSEGQFASFGAGQFRLTGETFIERDAAYIVALRNGVNPFSFRVYNTFTDASNYERAKIAWESNVLRIGTEKLGTGSARALELQTDGVTRLTINTAGNASFSGNVTSATGVMQLSNVMFTCGSSIANLYGNLFQPVSLRVFNTTDVGGTNFEYGQFAWNSNVLQIGTVKGGTGSARALELQTDGTTRFTIAANGQMTFAEKTTLASATVSSASANIPSGSDPSSPNNGDIWQNSNLLKVRLNGRTQTLSYQITSGTAAPTGGSDGDIYLQYI